jgi:hypothetical protein
VDYVKVSCDTESTEKESFLKASRCPPPLCKRSNKKVELRKPAPLYIYFVNFLLSNIGGMGGEKRLKALVFMQGMKIRVMLRPGDVGLLGF